MPRRTQTQSAVVPFDPKARAKEISTLIEARRDQIASFLQADDATYERFVSVALDAITKDTNVLSADPFSIVQSIRHAAIMGLEPTSVMGEGAIVVYRDSDAGKKLAQFQPMVRGLAKLARNSGEVAAIGVDVVHEKDVFEYRSGSDPAIVHEPYIEDDDPGAVKGAYAFAKLRSGELIPLYMTSAQILKRRNVSKSFRHSGEASIWGQWPEEMMKKTVLRRLLVEKVPLSFRAQKALALDAEIDSLTVATPTVPALPAGRRPASSRLRARFEGDETAENGSGAEEDAEADTDTGPEDGAAQEAGPAACGAVSEDPEYAAGGPCDREAHKPSVLHRNGVGTWA